MHDLLHGGREVAVLQHGKHGKTAAVVIAGEYKAVVRVRTDVAGTGAGELMIDKGECAGAAVEGIGVHAAGIVFGEFADCVQKAFVGR